MEVARKLNAEEKEKLRDNQDTSPELAPLFVVCCFGVPFLH